MIYQAIKGSRGTRYLRDGKLFSKDKLPIDVLGALGEQEAIKGCEVCGAVASKMRFYNLQTIDCCDTHYKVSLGTFAQLLREKDNA